MRESCHIKIQYRQPQTTTVNMTNKIPQEWKIEPETNITLPNLEKADRVGELQTIQTHNPLHNVFFDKSILSTVCFKQDYYIVDSEHVAKSYDPKANRIPQCMFIKSAPLIDPIHYLIGKYVDDDRKWLNLPQPDSTDCTVMRKLLNRNNTSYIDMFFNFLSSQLLSKHEFIHGIQFYGSFLGIQKKFVFNAYDDIEYLQESDFFLDNAGKLYEIDESMETESEDEKQNSSPVNHNTQQKRPKLTIGDGNNDDISIDLTEEIPYDNVEIPFSTGNTSLSENDLEIVYENAKKKNGQNDSDADDSDSDESDNDSDSSSINYSTDEDAVNLDESREKTSDDDEDDDDDGDDDEENHSDDDHSSCQDTESSGDDFLPLYIYDFPVQMIALEKCDGTLDELLEKEDITENELTAALAQVIFTLIAYQKMFSFTHNDLHTNNILFKKTKQKHIVYCLDKQHYKVPTYGRIFKIIDFGRSIYRFENHIFCSDSFAPGGDANGQYNTEPYWNKKKPRLEPNFSFDLCRLGCSLYNFFFDPDEPLPQTMTPIQTLVHSWCLDDQNMNVLYKRNGEERYPNFKLYKMIARLVHNKTPISQLKLPMFSKYQCPKPKRKTAKDPAIMNIDQLPILFSSSLETK